jgi:hypothetical protein
LELFVHMSSRQVCFIYIHICPMWRWWWWSCRRDETTSLNCGHKRDYCSSPRWYMNMGNHGWWCRLGKNPDRSTRALSGNPNRRTI